MTERDIFLAAIDLPAAERAAYLDCACGGDAALRGQVEALLRSHEEAGSFLNLPALNTQDNPSPRAYPTPDADPEDGPTRTHGEAGEETDDTADALRFLAPGQRPGSLGRIGHYEVLEILGRGAFGIVFRAFDDMLQRVVAVKVLAPSMAATSPARKRFLREARSAALIQHENVVRIHETGEQPLPYLVMEFVAGETLQQRLDRIGPLDVAEVLRIGRQIAEGLAAAHEKGLIHRDIKPSNILIERGPQERAKITDFGLARAADDASLTRSGTVAGTPLYMAPEQAKGETLDHRADLFSLGSVLYAMLTGRPPFRAETTLAVLKRVAEDTPRPIRDVIPEVPEWFCRIVEKLHTKDPTARFQSAREVTDLLADCERQLQAHGKLTDFSRIPGGQLARPRRSLARRWKWAAAAVVLLLGLGGGALALFGWGSSARPGSVTIHAYEPGLLVEIDEQDVPLPPVSGRNFTHSANISLQPGLHRVSIYRDNKMVYEAFVQTVSGQDQEIDIPLPEPSTAPSAPRKASEVLAFLAGTWKTESLILEPKVPPDFARVTGVSRHELVAGGKFLRGLGGYGNGLSQALFVQRYDEGSGTLRGWFFYSSGDFTGSAVGVWDAERRTLLVMEKWPNGNQTVQQYEFVDGNTLKARVFHQNDKNETVLDVRQTLTRLDKPAEVPRIKVDHKRPHEEVLLDRLVGDWENQGILKTKENPAGVPFTGRLQSRSVLGGRLIESEETGDEGSYWLAAYDQNRKAYRHWVFLGSGDVLSLVGNWDEKTQTMNWSGAGLDGSDISASWHWTAPDVWEWSTLSKGAGGKKIDITGTSRRTTR
jgi:serine/threonine protein kinase